MRSGKRIGLLTQSQKFLVLGPVLFGSLCSYTPVINAQNAAMEAAKRAAEAQAKAVQDTATNAAKNAPPSDAPLSPMEAAKRAADAQAKQVADTASGASGGGTSGGGGTDAAADLKARRDANIQKKAEIEPSQKVNDELERIYKSDETVQIPGFGDIQPWKDAKVMMKAHRNSQLELEIKAMNYALYLQGMETKTGSEDYLLSNHFGRFCAGSSANEGGLSDVSCARDAALQYADIMPSGFEGFRIDSEQEAALIYFIKNLVNPFPPEALSNPDLLTAEKMKDPKNRKLVAQTLAEQTAFAAARQALTSSLVKRRPIADLGGKSFMEILEKEAGKDFLNDGWQKQNKKNYDTAISKGKLLEAAAYDDAPRQAFNNFLLYQNLRELEQIKILLAVQVSILQQQAQVGANIVSTASGGSKSK